MINVFPQPYKFEERTGEFIFKNKVYLILDKDFDNKEFLKLSPELWNNFTAYKSELEVVFCDNLKGSARIALTVDEKPIMKDTEFEYELECNENGIDIAYSETIGLIHAFATILQLISAYRRKTDDFVIKNILVQDKPALKMRAMHLCVFPETKLLFLTKLVRLCGLLKCSHVIIEFWGMLKLETLEYLAWPFAYTKQDLEPIFEYGKALGLEFIPLYNHLGHATQSRFKAGKNVILDQAPEYEELFLPGGWTWDIHNPETVQLLRDIREELCDIFPEGEYFHIGCDEAYVSDTRWEGYDKDNINYINSISEHLKSKGRKTLMWADIFLSHEKMQFPYVVAPLPEKHCNESIEALDKDIYLADWQYYIDEKHDGSVKYLTSKHDPKKIVICPWDDSVRIRGMARLAKNYGLLGVMGTTWNIINHEIRDMVYTACVMWDTDDKNTDACTWETLKVFAAQNIRKLVPSKGKYADAGFLETELFHVVN